MRLADASACNSNFDYSTYESSVGSSSSQLESKVQFSQSTATFDWALMTDKINDLSDEGFIGSGTFGGVERLPELALSSDTKRLGDFMPFGIPANFKMAFGSYVELPNPTDLGRVFMEADTPRSTTTWARDGSSPGARAFGSISTVMAPPSTGSEPARR